MTDKVLVSVKIPTGILEAMPAAGRGRSGFIVEAIAEKIARRSPVPWQPTTARGRHLAALLAKGRAERGARISDAAVEQELRERRGRNF